MGSRNILNLGDVLAVENKALKELKIESLTRGSSPTIAEKINGTPAANTIYAGAGVSIMRRDDLRTTPETIR